MKKEEFPTFLNEQPTIIFNRTGRELLIITAGLALAYLSWGDLGHLIHGTALVITIFKGFVAAIFVIAAVIVAFFKVASRPLEEWASIWLFYILVPKVYIYMPVEESAQTDNQSQLLALESIHSRTNDDDFEDDY